MDGNTVAQEICDLADGIRSVLDCIDDDLAKHHMRYRAVVSICGKNASDKTVMYNIVRYHTDRAVAHALMMDVERLERKIVMSTNTMQNRCAIRAVVSAIIMGQYTNYSSSIDRLKEWTK